MTFFPCPFLHRPVIFWVQRCQKSLTFGITTLHPINQEKRTKRPPFNDDSQTSMYSCDRNIIILKQWVKKKKKFFFIRWGRFRINCRTHKCKSSLFVSVHFGNSIHRVNSEIRNLHPKSPLPSIIQTPRHTIKNKKNYLTPPPALLTLSVL